MEETVFAGLDGARGGWVCALWAPAARRLAVHRLPHLNAVLALPQAPVLACLDMPVGLHTRACPGGRPCDIAARRLLRAMGGRPSSIFSPPARPALVATTHAEASARNRASGPAAPGLSIQAFNLFPLLRQVDDTLTPARQDRLVEAHPELVFSRLAGGQAPPPKRRPDGRAARRNLLISVGLPAAALDTVRPGALEAAWDDVLDACILAWLAAEVAAGRALRTQQAPDVDARGLRMEIWY